MNPNDVEYIHIYIYDLCACNFEMNHGHDQPQTHLDPSVPNESAAHRFHGQRAVPGARHGVHVDAAAVAAEAARAAGSQKPDQAQPLVVAGHPAKTLKVSWDQLGSLENHWRIIGK